VGELKAKVKNLKAVCGKF